jgi:hypothetical protein
MTVFTLFEILNTTAALVAAGLSIFVLSIYNKTKMGIGQKLFLIGIFFFALSEIFGALKELGKFYFPGLYPGLQLIFVIFIIISFTKQLISLRVSGHKEIL